MAFKHYKYFIDREPLMQFACFECRKSFNANLGAKLTPARNAANQCAKWVVNSRRLNLTTRSNGERWKLSFEVELLARGSNTQREPTDRSASLYLRLSPTPQALNIFNDGSWGSRYAPPQALCRHPLRGLTRITQSNYLIASPLFTTRGGRLLLRSISER
jgi:hypothetical protein